MKKYLKLLKAWKSPAGEDFAIGKTIEVTVDTDAAKAMIADMLINGVAELTAEPVQAPAIDAKAVEGMVVKAIEGATQKIADSTAKAISAITTHDRSDDDPSHGYLPHREKRTRDEKMYGLGLFAADVYAAGSDLANPPARLKKSIERSRNMIAKAMQEGIIGKAAGTGMTIGEDDSMGALIPPEFSTLLLDVAAETAIIRPRAAKISLSSNSIQLPKVEDYDRSGGLVYGGMVAYWKGENAVLTESRPKHEELQLTLNALTILAYSSHQAMRFSPMDLGSYLLPKMASAITWKEEDAFINGTGAGMPLGMLNAGCKVEIAIESGQTSTANTIVSKNVDKMISRLKVMQAASCAFLYSRPELYNWLINLSRPVGTGGQLAMLYTASGNPLNGGAMLNGVPLFDSEHMPAAGTVGDLTLADLSQYIIADDRRGPETAQSMHLKFDYGQEAFRIIKYVDGQPADRKATTRYKGSATISPVMAIAVRA